MSFDGSGMIVGSVEVLSRALAWAKSNVLKAGQWRSASLSAPPNS